MNIVINNAEIAEATSLLKAIERATQYSESDPELGVQIWVASRRKDGWLKYDIDIHSGETRRIFIAMIQRTQTSEFEFHS